MHLTTTLVMEAKDKDEALRIAERFIEDHAGHAIDYGNIIEDEEELTEYGFTEPAMPYGDVIPHIVKQMKEFVRYKDQRLDMALDGVPDITAQNIEKNKFQFWKLENTIKLIRGEEYIAEHNIWDATNDVSGCDAANSEGWWTVLIDVHV